MLPARLSRTMVWMLLPTIVIAGVVAFGLRHARVSAGDPTSNSLASVGVRYGVVPATFRPTISEEQAVALARARVVSRLLEPNAAVKVEAVLVLFSNDQYYTENERGEKTYHHQNIPAWVVTFRDVKFPMNQPRGASGDALYNTEVSVAIDAVTGDVLELYTYK